MNELIAVKLTISFFLLTLFTPEASEGPIFDNAATATQVVKICHPNSQVQAAQTSCDDPTQTNIVVDPYGIAIAKLDVRAAYLQPTVGGYTLPPGIPPMYIEYDLPDGSFDVVGPVDLFQEDDTNPNIYVSVVDLTYDFSEPCLENNKQVIPYTSNVRLVSTNNPVDPNPYYLVQEYREPGQIFTCEIFHETCGWEGCPNPAPNCTSTTKNAEADFYFCINCIPINDGAQDGTGDDMAFIGDSNPPQALLNKETVIEITPNPFQASFDLALNIPESKSISILIYDVTGGLIAKHDHYTTNGVNTFSIDSHDWQSGIYYVQINGLDTTKTLKLVKF